MPVDLYLNSKEKQISELAQAVNRAGGQKNIGQVPPLCTKRISETNPLYIWIQQVILINRVQSNLY